MSQIVVKATKQSRESFWCKMKLSPALMKLKSWGNIVLTFIVVSYLWMIFRSSSFEQVVDITIGYAKGGPIYVHPTTLVFFAIGFVILLVKDFKDEYFPDKHFLMESKYAVVRCLSCAVLAAVIVFFGILGGGQFIYFQF